jgi:hypothetical protein
MDKNRLFSTFKINLFLWKKILFSLSILVIVFLNPLVSLSQNYNITTQDSSSFLKNIGCVQIEQQDIITLLDLLVQSDKIYREKEIQLANLNESKLKSNLKEAEEQLRKAKTNNPQGASEFSTE